ncbi:MAG: hypothetical protein ACLURV_14840 [Gallintestinimicrobium sp.]
MFGLRLAVSLMLFAGVIYLDKNQIDWRGSSCRDKQALETCNGKFYGGGTALALQRSRKLCHLSIFKMGKSALSGLYVLLRE